MEAETTSSLLSTVEIHPILDMETTLNIVFQKCLLQASIGILETTNEHGFQDYP